MFAIYKNIEIDNRPVLLFLKYIKFLNGFITLILNGFLTYKHQREPTYIFQYFLYLKILIGMELLK